MANAGDELQERELSVRVQTGGIELVEQIVDAYKRQFHQESVLWVRAAAYARF